MPAPEVRERLDRLREHGFITDWRQEDRRWYVESALTWGPYSRSQIVAFIEGANAMGAAP